LLYPGESLAADEQGDVTIKLPLPPGCLPTVWGDHQQFLDSYMSQYEGYYNTGDEGYIRTVTICSSNTKAWTQPVFLEK